MTLKDYILRWQEVYDKNQSRPTTYAAHGYIFKNHILPGLGDIPLSELTVEQVGDFLEERKRFGGHRPESPEYPGLGEHTMRHIHRLLQQCLDQAIRDGLIVENPARAFHYPKPKKVSANVLTPTEVEDYLDVAERLGYLPMFLLALTAGLRQEELIALKWSDLDVTERTLTISESRSVERRELVEYKGGTRTIRLTTEAVELLRMEHARHPSSPLMFMHPATQKPYSPQMVRRMHNEIIKEAGLDHIRFADLRHTCAVLSLQNGMDTKEVSHMLGKLYLTGQGVAQDQAQAMAWFSRSAAQGNPYAQFFLEQQNNLRPPSVMLAVTQLLYHMSRIFEDNSVPSAVPVGQQVDRKLRRKIQEKKIAMGHKPDDHEEEQWPEMTM